MPQSPERRSATQALRQTLSEEDDLAWAESSDPETIVIGVTTSLTIAARAYGEIKTGQKHTLTLGNDQIQRVITKISRDGSAELAKAIKRRSHQPLTDLIRWAITPIFRNTGAPKKDIAATARSIAIHIPEWSKLRISEEAEVEEDEVRTVFIELLDHTQNLVADLAQRQGSVVWHLIEHPLCAAGIGIPLNLSDANDIAVLADFSQILISLKSEVAEEWLTTWLTTQLANPASQEPALALLTALSRQTMLWDYSVSADIMESHGKLPLAPYRGLHSAIEKTIRQLPNQETRLSQISQELLLFHEQAILEIPRTTTYVEPGRNLIAKPENVCEVLLIWISLCKKYDHPSHGHLTDEQVGLYVTRFLHSLDATPGVVAAVVRFFHSLGNEGKEIERLCKWYGLLPATIDELRKEALTILENRPIPDIAQVNFAQEIPPEANEVIFEIETGTDGPMHMQHSYNAETALADIHNSRKETSITFVLMIPIPNAIDLPGYTKQLERTGMLTERVMTIILNTLVLSQVFPDESRRLFLTSILQPSPNDTGDITTSLKVLMKEIRQKVARDFTLSKRQLPEDFQIRFKERMGGDEVEFTLGGREVSKNQKAKLSMVDDENIPVGVNIVAYLTLLTRFINSANSIHHRLPQVEHVNLVRGRPASSTRIIGDIEKGREPANILPIARHITNCLWSQEAIAKRAVIVQNVRNLRSRLVSKDLTDTQINLLLQRYMARYDIKIIEELLGSPTDLRDHTTRKKGRTSVATIAREIYRILKSQSALQAISS